MSDSFATYPKLGSHEEPIGYQKVLYSGLVYRQEKVAEALHRLAHYIAAQINDEPSSSALRAACRDYVKATVWYETLSAGPEGRDTILALCSENIELNISELGAPQIREEGATLLPIGILPRTGVILPEMNGIPFYPDMDGYIFLRPQTLEALRKLNQSDAWQEVCRIIEEEQVYQKSLQQDLVNVKNQTAKDTLRETKDALKKIKGPSKLRRSLQKTRREETVAVRERERKETGSDNLLIDSIKKHKVKIEIAPELIALLDELTRAGIRISRTSNTLSRKQSAIKRLQTKILETATPKTKELTRAQQRKRQRQLDSLKEMGDAILKAQTFLVTTAQQKENAAQNLNVYLQKHLGAIKRIKRRPSRVANPRRVYWTLKTIQEIFRNAADTAEKNMSAKEAAVEKAIEAADTMENLTIIQRRNSGYYLPKYNKPESKERLAIDLASLGRMQRNIQRAETNFTRASTKAVLITNELARAMKELTAHIQMHSIPNWMPKKPTMRSIERDAIKHVRRALLKAQEKHRQFPKPRAPSIA